MTLNSFPELLPNFSKYEWSVLQYPNKPRRSACCQITFALSRLNVAIAIECSTLPVIFRDRLLKDTEPKWNNWRAQLTGQYWTQDKSMGMPHSGEKICWKNCSNCKTQNRVSNFRAPFMSAPKNRFLKWCDNKRWIGFFLHTNTQIYLCRNKIHWTPWHLIGYIYRMIVI